MARGRDNDGLLLASRGKGPLLERDYWAVLRRCSLSPREVAGVVASRFCQLPPEELVRFTRLQRDEGPLEPGDELDVDIRAAGRFRVRVVHKDANSVTIATLPRHPEAGRITFGAYRALRGDVIFHIRSRARSSSRVHRLGFVAAGEPMQTNTWTDFIDRLAAVVAEGVIGPIWAETRVVDDEAADTSLEHAPTFLARGA